MCLPGLEFARFNPGPGASHSLAGWWRPLMCPAVTYPLCSSSMALVKFKASEVWQVESACQSLFAFSGRAE